MKTLAEAVDARSGESPEPSLDVPAEPIRLRADRARLVAVLGNLIQNAQEATPPDGSVRVPEALRPYMGGRATILAGGAAA